MPSGSVNCAEEPGADADDHGQHQHLDAGGHDVAQHALGEERGAVPQREGHQHESGERGELEFEQRHEELHGEHEEADQDDEPGEEQHDDAVEVQKHAGKPGEVADLDQDRLAGSQRPRWRAVLAAGTAPAGSAGPGGEQTQAREGAKEDAREAIEVVDDEGEGADVERLLDQPGEDVVGAAHRPEESGERHVDDDQRRREKCDLGPEQAEARVDVLREDIQEPVDDAEIVHDPASQGVGSMVGARLVSAQPSSAA